MRDMSCAANFSAFADLYRHADAQHQRELHAAFRRQNQSVKCASHLAERHTVHHFACLELAAPCVQHRLDAHTPPEMLPKSFLQLHIVM